MQRFVVLNEDSLFIFSHKPSAPGGPPEAKLLFTCATESFLEVVHSQIHPTRFSVKIGRKSTIELESRHKDDALLWASTLREVLGTQAVVKRKRSMTSQRMATLKRPTKGDPAQELEALPAHVKKSLRKQGLLTDFGPELAQPSNFALLLNCLAFSDHLKFLHATPKPAGYKVPTIPSEEVLCV